MLERAAQLDPRDASLSRTLGETYYFLRRPSDATRALNRALALDATDPPSLFLKQGVLANLLGDTAAARRFVDGEGTRMPPRVRAYAAGLVAFRARDFRTALTEFAKRESPAFSVDARRELVLADAAAASGDSLLARAYADTLVRKARAELARIGAHPRSDLFGRRSGIEAQMAIALAILGDHAQAVRLAEASAHRYSVERDALGGAQVQTYLATTYMIVGRHADAIAVLRRLLAIPSTMTVHRLRLTPSWDPLRGDPEFQRLLADQR